MGYSKSKKAVRHVQSYLDRLLEAETDISFPSRNPQKLAYALHNGLYAAAYHPDTQKYLVIKKKFMVRYNANVVKCEVKDALESLRQKADNLTLEDIIEPIGVIGAMIKHKADIMTFPDFNGNIIPIQNWAGNNGYNVNQLEEGISLIKDGVEI